MDILVEALESLSFFLRLRLSPLITSSLSTFKLKMSTYPDGTANPEWFKHLEVTLPLEKARYQVLPSEVNSLRRRVKARGPSSNYRLTANSGPRGRLPQANSGRKL